MHLYLFDWLVGWFCCFVLFCLINRFIYLHPKCFPLLGPPSLSSSLMTPPLCLWEGAHTHAHAHVYLPLWASSLYRIRHILSHWGQTRQSSATYVPGAMDHPMYALWWLSLWELWGVHVNWYCCSSYGVVIPFSSFSPSPNSFTLVANLSSMVDCKYLHLSLSAADRATQRTTMLGSCLQFLLHILSLQFF